MFVPIAFSRLWLTARRRSSARSAKKTSSVGTLLVVQQLLRDLNDINDLFQGHFKPNELQRSLSDIELVIAFVTDPLESFLEHVSQLLQIPCLDVSLDFLKALVDLRGDSRLEKLNSKKDCEAEFWRLQEKRVLVRAHAEF